MGHPAIQILVTYTKAAWHRAHARDHEGGERGSVSLETVLWYTLTALGVIAVGTILFTAIKAKASEPLPTPTAP